jgi:hypothetical protein
MEKIPLENKELSPARDTDFAQSFNELVRKINEIIDWINKSAVCQVDCNHNWVQSTSGYWCDKCNKYKTN